MKYLKVFCDFATTIEALSDAEKGRLFTAMLESQKKKYNIAISQGIEYINAGKDAADATSCLALIKGLEHALTSEKELVAAYKKKCSGIGLKWDKAAKAWTNA